MQPKRIVVVGGGFAGLWSAVGAARKLDELGMGSDKAQVTLIERNPYHSIRVRNYEQNLEDTIVPLADVLVPVGIEHVQASAAGFDFDRKLVHVSSEGSTAMVPYDRLVLALGSQVLRPDIPGLAQFGFDVDTYAAACRLDLHIKALSDATSPPGRNTVLVIGSGFTGVEVATEMSDRLKRTFGSEAVRIVVADASPVVGPAIGVHARPVIEKALSDLNIELRLGVRVTNLTGEGAWITGGEFIQASTIVWCAGMTASPLTALLPVERDRLGRVAVDSHMRVIGLPDVFAAGDCAWTFVEPGHASVMSCQHSRPMGRFAGHNVVADLFAVPSLPMEIDQYVTILDLGSWGALYTVGWDRQILSQGSSAKETKRVINCKRIYPPRSQNRAEILAAAAPIIQAPPEEFASSPAGR